MELVEGKEVSPGILLYENALNEDYCNEIIKKAQEDFVWSKAKTSNKNYEKQFKTEGDDIWAVREDERDTENVFLVPTFMNDVFWFSLSKFIWTYADQYCKINNIIFSDMEVPQLLRYKKNKGFYVNHTDSSTSIQRIFSCIIYLNDVEDGGETYFDRINLTIRPKIGTLVIFPADYVHSHEAAVPISNEKFVVVTWFSP